MNKSIIKLLVIIIWFLCGIGYFLYHMNWTLKEIKTNSSRNYRNILEIQNTLDFK